MLARGPRSGLESIFQIFLCLRVYGEGSQKSSGAQACLIHVMGPFFGGGGGVAWRATLQDHPFAAFGFRLRASDVGFRMSDPGRDLHFAECPQTVFDLLLPNRQASS